MFKVSNGKHFLLHHEDWPTSYVTEFFFVTKNRRVGRGVWRAGRIINFNNDKMEYNLDWLRAENKGDASHFHTKTNWFTCNKFPANWPLDCIRIN